jgi:2-succinyl-5-enolpyruvyl-6-hydroxy-3-cyclohexene-1-carboxylate synthase
MYSDNQSVQILISLLKEFGVKSAVLSPGSRNVPIVHSLEKDPYFQCYSIVDERSAGYFAMGLALETRQPVLVSCTSGTAAANYTSAICEAFYQDIPLLVLTSDRNPYYLNQLEDQMIPQTELYRGICKRSVSLPIIKDDKDYWYCRRVANEALLEMNHNGRGPVHINIPIEWGLFAENFNAKELPVINPIRIVSLRDLYAGNKSMIQELKAKERILILYGQSPPVNEKEKKSIESFASKYKCVIAVETISNMKCRGSIETYVLSQVLTKEDFKEYAPDLVISVNLNYVSKIKNLLKGCPFNFEHWTVNERGAVVDQFKKLTRVFECSAMEFFTYFDQNGGDPVERNEYLDFWQAKIKLLEKPEFPYSNNYVMQEFLKKLPHNALLHLGNGMAVHLAQHFPSDESAVTYCHSGTTTIDGCVSTFIGHAAVCKRPCFMFAGDLGFFYDINALWNRYVGKNVRILLSNNEGGETFHWNIVKEIDSVNLHTAAEHFADARGWVESRGFRYLSARNKQEFDGLLPEFMSKDAIGPMFFEVFTKKETDARILLDFYEGCRERFMSCFR